MADDEDEALVSAADSPLRAPGFLFGFATSEYQASGEAACPENTWSSRTHNGFEHRRGAVKGAPLAPGSMSGAGCDSWHNIARDVELMRGVGASLYRFSVEWSVVEPQEGVFSAEAIAHYHALLDALHAAGIAPMATLLHFTQPSWFAAQGGFERACNIAKFVSFCTRVFAEFRTKCRLWCTVNEPGLMGLTGYIGGFHAPGHVARWGAAKTLVANLLAAHAEVYCAIKRSPGGTDALVGLAHNALKFECTPAWSPVSLLTDALTQHCHGTVMRFLRHEAAGLFDFFGLNFYSRALVSGTRFKAVSAGPEETMTPLGWATNPHSFFLAVKEAAALGKPVYITENGMTQNPAMDTHVPFLRGYLAALIRAMRDGADVRGYCWWTLLSNFEWDHGITADFGLYHYDFQTQQVAPPGPAVAYFRSAFAKHAPAPEPLAPAPAEESAPSHEEPTAAPAPAPAPEESTAAGSS